MTNKHYDNAMKRLKENNVRITPQRQIILKYLIENDNHPTVETIFNVLDKTFPNLSMATVYNNLRLFKKLNLIIELPSVDSGYRYDFYDHPHLHAACDICNKIPTPSPVLPSASLPALCSRFSTIFNAFATVS